MHTNMLSGFTRLLWLFGRDGIRVALKIIKNLERFREAALIKVEVLKQMNVLDSENCL